MYDEDQEELVWTFAAVDFGKNFVRTLIDIDGALRGSVEASPPPDWVAENEYRLESETELTSKISAISEEIEKLGKEKLTLSDRLRKEKQLKGLLFEKGKPLENAVIEALKILGYMAENYDDGNLELDQVIVDPDGERYIGETEGKDSKAINIVKFRQLQSSMQEYLEREDVTGPASGILFGNGFRFTHPEKREKPFTKKCLEGAKAQNLILVRTPDLFKAAKYLRENGDEEFARKCRKAILRSRGKTVRFPEP